MPLCAEAAAADAAASAATAADLACFLRRELVRRELLGAGLGGLGTLAGSAPKRGFAPCDAAALPAPRTFSAPA